MMYKKSLDKPIELSWAKVFADEIFPAIDEKRFSVLYSDKASRPNTPVNVIVSALIIKELFDYSDDEMGRKSYAGFSNSVRTAHNKF